MYKRQGIDRGDGAIGTLICNVPGLSDGNGFNAQTGDSVDAEFEPDPADLCLIETVVHEIIPASARLVSQLPAIRWVTGIGRFDDDSPYCSVNIEGGSPDLRTNTGRIDREIVRFKLYTGDHTQGRKIQETLINVLDDLSYKFIASNGTRQVLLARVQNKFGFEEPSHIWQFLTDVIFWSEKRNVD